MDSENAQKDLQIQIQSLQQQLRQSHLQQEQFSRLQQAIQRMYAEFSDRTLNCAQQDIQTSESPLVTLDKLRAQLRIMLAFRDDYDAQIQQQNKNSANESQNAQHSLQNKLLQAQDQIFQLKQELSKAKSDLNNYENQLSDQHQNINDQIQQYQAKNEALEKQKLQLQKQQNDFKQKIDRQNILMKNQDLKLARISELEAKLQQKETEFQSRIAKVQTLDRNEILRLQKEISNFKRVETENLNLKQQINQMQLRLNSYKNNLKEQKFEQLSSQLAKYQQLIDEKNQQIAALTENYKIVENDKILAQQELRSLQAQAKNSSENIGVMQQQQVLLQQQQSNLDDEFLFQRTSNRPQTASSYSAYNNQARYKNFRKEQEKEILAQHQLQTALDKLKERDREIEELSKRVTKLLALQHKSLLSQKAFLEEKQTLEKQIQQLRDEVAGLRKMQSGYTQKKALSTTANQDELLKDVQNLKAYAITASAAANSHQGKNLSLVPMEDVQFQERWSANQGSADLQAGRGGGYGANKMLGRARSAVSFGLVM